MVGNQSAPKSLVLALGSNLGDSETILRETIRKLRDLYGPLRVAPLYRSAPISPIDQDDFYNTIVVVESLPPASPHAVLAQTQALEKEAGRRFGPRWGPRPLDIDLLLWGDLELDSEFLTIPHPRLRLRRFVLVPLVDLEPEIRLPPDALTARQTLLVLEASLEDSEQRLKAVPWQQSP